MEWKEQFQPIVETGWSIRSGQEKLGNAIIKTLDGTGKPLVGNAETGTGKSLACLIPIIHKIKEARSNHRPYRAVVSTETITLQRQLEKKDLPFLQKIYSDVDFSFHKLLGRSNYLCLERAKEEAKGNRTLSNIVDAIDRGSQRLTSGERYDVEEVLGYSLTNDIWRQLSGDNQWCSENQCDILNCYASQSRKHALNSDIIVVNHTILAIDFEMKGMNPESEGMVGTIDAIIVDEAHKLEETLSNQWTERYTQYEVTEHLNRIVEAAEKADTIDRTSSVLATAETLRKEVLGFYKTTLDFFCEIEERAGRKWENAEVTFKTQYITRPTPKLRSLMEEFEIKGLAILETMIAQSKKLEKSFLKVLDTDSDNKFTKGFKKSIRKGQTSLKFMAKFSEILKMSMNSDSGIIDYRGLTYGTIIEGYISQGKTSLGEKRMTIRAFPIDVSGKAKKIWGQGVACVFISATLIDLTRDDFEYFKKSLGISNSNDIRVESPFNMIEQQIVYVTKQDFRPMEGSHFSLEEVVELVNRANGRSLLLFTSKKELEQAHKILLEYKVAGKFPYTMYVQDPEIDKAKLVDMFKNDTHSVLLGLKSFFTGVDIPGESLSLVVVCKWPNPRYSTECRMKMSYWKDRGFPQWYSRESLTVFQQAAGRLIRSESCKGVVSVLDQRAFDANSPVFKSAHLGVSTLGSRVTHNLDDVSNHLGVLHAVR